MHMHVGVVGQECFNQLAPVGGEVVGNDMDLFTARLIGHDVSQKRDELCRGVPRSRIAKHFTRPRVECHIERYRAMPVVFETMALSPTRRKSQHGILAIQRLNTGYTAIGRILKKPSSEQGGAETCIAPRHADLVGEMVSRENSRVKPA